MPTGAVLASEKYPALEVLRTSKTIPFGEGSSKGWAFTVVVRSEAMLDIGASTTSIYRCAGLG
mgnify:CR=1 FL=1